MHAPVVFLVRHGQTAWNTERRFLGRTDVPLDTTGASQAARLATHLVGLDAVWSSPLARARETAAALGAPRLHPGLAEMDMGELEGLGGPEVAARYPDLLPRWFADPSTVDIPGGESMAVLQERVVRAWAELEPSLGAGRVAVVTHQLALASLLCALTGTPLPDFRRFSHRNTAYTTLRLTPAGPVVEAVDQAPHLDPG